MKNQLKGGCTVIITVQKSIMQNKVMLEGNVVRKNYQQYSKRLYLTLVVFGTSKEGPVVDYPTIIFDGDMAEKVDRLIPESLIADKKAYVETEGFLETFRQLHKVDGEKNRYEYLWQQRITGTYVSLMPSIRSKNAVIISAKVRNVWENAARHYYAITMVDDDKHVFTVIYFDYKMLLKPVAGEILECNAVVHTRNVTRNGKRVTEFSVNAWRITRPGDKQSISVYDEEQRLE